MPLSLLRSRSMIMGRLRQILPRTTHDHQVGRARRQKCPVCPGMPGGGAEARVTYVTQGQDQLRLSACRLLTRGFRSRDERDVVCCGECGEFGEGLDLDSGRLDDVAALVQERPDLPLGLWRWCR
jgi:hypothetical protein